MTNYNELNNNLETLNLLRMKELLPNTIEKSIKSNISLLELKLLLKMKGQRKLILPFQIFLILKLLMILILNTNLQLTKIKY